jgi:polyphosphate kinase 2 (PPK2 family)
MKEHKRARKIARLADPYCVRKGKKFRLEDVDPAGTSGVKSEAHALKLLEQSTEIVRDRQEKLYAQDSWALLLIFQGMDAAGKDGVIKHVMSGVNPQGCDVRSFKTPSHEDLDHDYLDLVKAERLPEPLGSEGIWDDRYEDIKAHERYLTRNGVVIRKFFLHVSKAEQKRRFLARLDDPTKNWKFSISDIAERKFWPDYQHAYEAMVRHTATKYAPWYVVPADHKWYTHLIVAAAIVDTLDELDLTFPEADKSKRKELAKIRAALLASPD